MGKVSSLNDCQRVQADLDAVNNWPEANCLPISLTKSFCTHVGSKNVFHTYNIGGMSLSTAVHCSGLEVIRTSDFLYTVSVETKANKASCFAKMIIRVCSMREVLFLKNWLYLILDLSRHMPALYGLRAAIISNVI